ncbi:hypothetical protein WI94_07120 [Burkholderia vietnamiensis]|nr:hypothetical protein WI94_07120 [Burkholderia vietnamiensis]KVE86000.1 hypothetical protein WJ00_14150 [Burkholderia vietnamiensis]
MMFGKPSCWFMPYARRTVNRLHMAHGKPQFDGLPKIEIRDRHYLRNATGKSKSLVECCWCYLMHSIELGLIGMK